MSAIQLFRQSTFNPRRESVLFDDFAGNSASTSESGFQSGVSGAGASVSILASPGATRPGVWRHDTGTTTSGRATTNRPLTNWVFGSGRIIFQFGFRLPALSTSSEEYIWHCGFGDSATADMTDGVYAWYDRATSGDFLVFGTAAASTRTKKVLDGTSGNPTFALTAGDWIDLLCDVNADATLAAFYYAKSGAAFSGPVNISTNIPSGTNYCGPVFNIRKTAGTAARQADFDYWYSHILFSEGRQ